MKIPRPLYIIISLFFFFGCSSKKEVEIDFSMYLNSTDHINENYKNKKTLVLLVESPQCKMCGLIKEKIKSNKWYNPNIKFVSVSSNSPQDRWLLHLVRMPTFPLTIILSPENNLNALVAGDRIDIVKNAIEAVQHGNSFLDIGKFPFLNLNSTNLNDNTEKIQFLNEVFKISLEKNNLSELRNNIKKQPYFYNEYLNYAMTLREDSSAALTMANNILKKYNDPIDDYVYGDLKENLWLKTNHQFTKPIGPLLAVENKVIDFGTDRLGANKIIEIEVKNIGNKGLFLKEVLTSCQCIEAIWDSTEIKAGEMARIKLKYQMKELGKFKQNIIIFSNSYSKPTELSIEGNVIIK